jgi:hypothetical protein
LYLIRADITSRWYQQLRWIENGSVPIRQEPLIACTSLRSVSLYGNISDFGVLEMKHASERAALIASHDLLLAVLAAITLQVDSLVIDQPQANSST